MKALTPKKNNLQQLRIQELDKKALKEVKGGHRLGPQPDTPTKNPNNN